MALRKWKKQSTWSAHGGLNQTKHCSNVWLQCIDSNAPGTTRLPNRERKRLPETRITMSTSTSTTQRPDQQKRVNHLRDRILAATETSKQTLGRHGGSKHEWGGITRHSRTRLVVFNHNVNANLYVNEVLAHIVVPFLQDNFP